MLFWHFSNSDGKQLKENNYSSSDVELFRKMRDLKKKAALSILLMVSLGDLLLIFVVKVRENEELFLSLPKI